MRNAGSIMFRGLLIVLVPILAISFAFHELSLGRLKHGFISSAALGARWSPIEQQEEVPGEFGGYNIIYA